jgi:uncharacterized MAPEG superfamily protein
VQLNSFEITPAFAVSVIIVHQLNATQTAIDKLAIAFVITRCLYAAYYLANKAALRTMTWVFGFGCIIAIFVLKLQIRPL